MAEQPTPEELAEAEENVRFALERDKRVLLVLSGWTLSLVMAEYDRRAKALAILADLVAGADDSRCWYIPGDIGVRARALLNGETP